MNRTKRHPLRLIGILLLSFLLLCAVSAAALSGYNRIMLKREAARIRHQGQYVEVDGGNMNIYTEGSGAHTLVFLAGANTPAVIYDFKPLFSRLTDTYKIVVIEKFGYGYSDDAGGERSLSVLLRQDREALQKAGLSAPYILCPHSASGLEAIRWAQLYPEEIEAVIGLDMAVPEQFDCQGIGLHSTEPQSYEEMLQADDFYNFWVYDMGGYRLFRIADVFPAAASPDLTGNERAEYRAITYRRYSRFYETAMYREGIPTEKQLRDLAALHDAPVPDVPTLLLVSSDEKQMNQMFGENGLRTWVQIHENYAAQLTAGKLLQLDCGHYVHAEAPETVGTEIRQFIKDSL